jgi:hypothetical protein
MRALPLVLFLAGCATTPWGTWAFSLAVTEPVGDECARTVSHNFTGAHEPADTTVIDESWSTSSASAYSETLFFGRLEESGQGAVLIVGAEALPGSQDEAGKWTFSWRGRQESDDTATHASGYDYAHHYEATSTLLVKGSFNTETFTGAWTTESTSREKWDESDTWSDEAVAYVGENGESPVGTYLVLTGGDGVEVAANNARSAYDCENTGCTLSVEEACGYSYDLSGQLTAFEGQDSRWVQDAGQPAGL